MNKKFIFYFFVLFSLLLFLVSFSITLDYFISKINKNISVREMTRDNSKKIEKMNLKIDDFYKQLKEIKKTDSNFKIKINKKIEFNSDLISEISNRKNNINNLLKYLKNNKDDSLNNPVLWPTDGFVTSEFGARECPIDSDIRFHDGIDIAAPFGTKVISPSNGIVISITYMKQDGNLIKIYHNNNIITVYKHLYRCSIKSGTRVKKGDLIGYVGNNGRSTGYHLHYTVLHNGKQVNPRRYLKIKDN